MITLYQFPRAFGVNPSPFCLKIETALRLSGLEFKPKILGDTRKTPKGKLPYIQDEAQDIADSEFILDHLRDAHGVDFDADLTPAQRAIGCAFARMADDHLYWLLIMSRWLDEETWPATREGFFGKMPQPLRSLIPPLARRQVRANVNGHGIGKHGREELEQLARVALEALGTQVAEGFVAAEGFSRADLSVYAQLTNIIRGEHVTWLGEMARVDARLVGYLDRVDQHIKTVTDAATPA